VAVRERIRALIKEKGTTQAAVARRLDEPEYWVSDRLTGRVNLLAEELPRFAQALNVHPCTFFDEAPLGHTGVDYGQDLREQIAADVLDLARALSPARAAVVRRVLQGLDEAGVE
jgi:transcriptional regulator with XRE-family HTH domain